MTDKQKLAKYSRAINKLREAETLLAGFEPDLSRRSALIAITTETIRDRLAAKIKG